jgi:plastocyanin
MAASVPAPTATVGAREFSKYTGVVTLGLAMMGGAVVLVAAAAAVAGQSLSDSAAILTIAVVASAVGAVAVWRFGMVGKIVGMVAVVAVMSQVFWVPAGLFSPTSFADFSSGVMFTIGFVYSFGWGIAGLVRHNRMETHATAGEARMVRGAVIVTALAMVVSGVIQVTSRTTVSASEAAAIGAVPVTMSDFAFSQGDYVIPAGQKTPMLLHNSDASTHNFILDKLGINETVSPGSQKLVQITAPAGTYQILCTLHPDMEATLTAK